MGCQSSKSAEAPQETVTHPAPVKTLLESAEAPKEVSGDVATGSLTTTAAPTTTSTDEQPAELMPAASAATGVAPASSVVVPTGGPRKDNNCDTLEIGVPTNSGHSHGVLKRQGTLCTKRNGLDIMVVEFSSHDSTVGKVLGRNCKEMKWKVMFDLDKEPIDIKLHVQEHKLHYNEVTIESNGEQILQRAGAHANHMMEDFHYQWPFRATIRGIKEVDYFEVRPHLNSDVWFPATITGQRLDGWFEVRALEPDGSGRIIEITYPAVHKENLREASSHKLLEVPENSLTLEVPQQDPLKASLRLGVGGEGELVTHHFGRPSPPLMQHKQLSDIVLKVSKDRKEVNANIGHSVLSQFVSGEVRAVTRDVERLRQCWTVQLGPFAEHSIQIVKKHTLSKIVTLLVDGELLVESTAADIGCDGKEWQCDFRFIGERVIDFELYKTNAEGTAQDTTDHVKERRKYVHECSILIPNEWDFTTAHLFVDAKPFNELPVKPEQREEQNLTMAPLAMLHSYGIATPYIVDKTAPSNMMALASLVIHKADDKRQSAGGFFARCCDCSSVAAEGVSHT